jgi:sulfonate transport system ATP-binding protein
MTADLSQRERAPLRLVGASSHGVAVDARGVSKSFGASTVLRHVDLAIAPGEFIAIVGRSGCGKSTLLRLLAGLEPAGAGNIVVDGKPRRGMADDTRVMFQDARLLPWRSVIRNVGLGLSGDWLPRAAQALEAVGLADRAGEWPAVLSGGQRQRVALARALVHAPRLLLLDEPLGALDALTRIDMQNLIARLWRQYGFTAVLVTHDVAEAVALADRVILIEGGGIALDQPIELSRPRERGDPDFAALEGQVLRRVMGQGGDHR